MFNYLFIPRVSWTWVHYNELKRFCFCCSNLITAPLEANGRGVRLTGSAEGNNLHSFDSWGDCGKHSCLDFHVDSLVYSGEEVVCDAAELLDSIKSHVHFPLLCYECHQTQSPPARLPCMHLSKYQACVLQTESICLILSGSKGLWALIYSIVHWNSFLRSLKTFTFWDEENCSRPSLTRLNTC